MGKLALNGFIKHLRGNVDGLVVRKIRGQYYLGSRARAKPDREPTAGQRAFRRRFHFASEFARRVQRDPELHAYYLPFARRRDIRVRAVAISDWFNPPKVTALDVSRYRGRRGDRIDVRATDLYGVGRVTVTLFGPDQRPLETGECVRQGKSWQYTATQTIAPGQAVEILARAYDRPQQVGELRLAWQPKPPRR